MMDKKSNHRNAKRKKIGIKKKHLTVRVFFENAESQQNFVLLTVKGEAF